MDGIMAKKALVEKVTRKKTAVLDYCAQLSLI